MSSQATVTSLPVCDFCLEQAGYDGKTVMGSWANMCALHFGQYGTGLGLGRGQKLVAVIDHEGPSKADFDKWLKRVDRFVQSKVGLSCYDLPDVCYYDQFSAGISAATAADDLIAESMAEMGFDW